MREIIILAAGTGTKMFPYDMVGSKTMRPAAGIPIMGHMVRALRSFSGAPIHIMTLKQYCGATALYFDGMDGVQVHALEQSSGSADTLLAGMGQVSGEEVLVVSGDTWIDPEDLKALYAQSAPAALCCPLGGERSMDWICARLDGGRVAEIGAHHRGESMTHRLAAFVLPVSFARRLALTPEYFPGMKVGEGAPRERYVEAALAVSLEQYPLTAVEAAGPYFDVDKPWHLLDLNEFLVHRRCGALTENRLGEGSSIAPDADIRGRVQLGRNSRIGSRVLVKGSLIVGDNTVIDNGAIFEGDAVVGSRTKITNYCQIYDGCSIGSGCIMDHAAELIGGMLMDRVYLYHCCEYFGAVGSYSDLGAGTLCGTLRFDDQDSIHRTKGRAEVVRSGFGSATYLGDYSRTGAGAILMPGTRVGAYTMVGAGVLAQGNIPPRSCVLLELTHITKPWGEEKYGW